MLSSRKINGGAFTMQTVCINVYGIREFNKRQGLAGNEGETYENIDVSRAATARVTRSEIARLHLAGRVREIRDSQFWKFSPTYAMIMINETSARRA